jgi:hypothetical protein
MTILNYLPFLIADALLIGGPAFCLTMCLSNPVSFALFDTLKDRHKLPIVMFTFYTVCAIGFGIFIFHGITFLLSWMPRERGQLNEGGLLSQVLGLIFAVVGSYNLLRGLSKVAHKFDDLELGPRAAVSRCSKSAFLFGCLVGAGNSGLMHCR